MNLPIERDVPLASHTTLEVGGSAQLFVRCTDEAEVLAAIRHAEQAGLRLRVLGGGSNLVISDAGVEGLVAQVATRGVRIERGAELTLLSVASGVPWDEVVELTVDEGLAGLECLSGIPGSTGATPIQNVGAYGQEVAETVHSVRAFDRALGREVTLDREACGFGYRHSRFKQEPERFVVLETTFALRAGGAPAVRYAELERALGGRGTPSLVEVRHTVLGLRRAKSMLIDPSDENRRSAGSFFTNPVVRQAEADRVVDGALRDGLVNHRDDVPRFAADPGRVKLAAAWLIERAGFHKGERRGRVGISTKHALALVNLGGGTSSELLSFAAEIQRRVSERFEISLEREPVLW